MATRSPNGAHIPCLFKAAKKRAVHYHYQHCCSHYCYDFYEIFVRDLGEDCQLCSALPCIRDHSARRPRWHRPPYPHTGAARATARLGTSGSAPPTRRRLAQLPLLCGKVVSGSTQAARAPGALRYRLGPFARSTLGLHKQGLQ